MSLLIAEDLMFEFDADVSAVELESALAQFGLVGDILELTEEERESSRVWGAKRFQVSALYDMHLGSDQEFIDSLGRLGKFVIGIANGEVFFYENPLADEYDDQNTETIELDRLLKYLAGADPPFAELIYKKYCSYWRFALNASSSSEASGSSGD